MTKEKKLIIPKGFDRQRGYIICPYCKGEVYHYLNNNIHMKIYNMDNFICSSCSRVWRLEKKQESK